MRAHLRFGYGKSVQRLAYAVLSGKMDDHIIRLAHVKVHRPHKVRRYRHPRTIGQHNRLRQLDHLRYRIRMLFIHLVGEGVRALGGAAHYSGS